jgi:hypothetical protein
MLYGSSYVVEITSALTPQALQWQERAKQGAITPESGYYERCRSTEKRSLYSGI